MNKIKKRTILLTIFICLPSLLMTMQASDRYISFASGSNQLQIITGSKPVDILCSSQDWEGVLMAAQSLSEDFGRVCGMNAKLIKSSDATVLTSGSSIIVGSLHSPLIQDELKKGVIERSKLEGKNEKYIMKVVDGKVIIAGSDKRGAIYGIYELSRQMGVSPWYWMMDVPTIHRNNVYVSAQGEYTDGEPKVHYRGIFINDEWPCFGNWAVQHFGGINSKCYQHIFELLLRLKANIMWPAMWSSAFFADDPQNGPLADKMGIVMGTSHHEPMNNAQQDWKRIGGIPENWNYETNKDQLQKFWRSGIERAKNWETVVTIGMRGDGDMAMTNSSDNKVLLERIVADQRKIISDVTGKRPEDVPQVWALYKEVQDYYDEGMKVPDDVTLLFCDDNWGNVRRLPVWGSAPRKGGYGMYYHFDYVGAPRNYKWMNNNPIPRVWEQMNLAYQYGVRQLWVVNVGDLKPMEYPIQFFLDMAWNPEKFNASNINQHSVDFCNSVFGPEYGPEVARILRTYAKWNRRMVLESLNDRTFSFNYDEWFHVVADYNKLCADALSMQEKLSKPYYSAYRQLIGYPVEVCANLYDMYYAVAMNTRLAKMKDPMTNAWADKVVECFKKDFNLNASYHALEGGKWNHLMEQPHIGYTFWSDPKTNIMPKVTRISSATAPQSIVFPTETTPVSRGKVGSTFDEKDGYVAIEAEHYTRKTDISGARWTVISEIGRTLSGITPQPVTANVKGMALEYDFTTTTSTNHAVVTLRFSPTLNFNKTGLRYAISIDGGNMITVNINGDYNGDLGPIQLQNIIDSQTVFSLRPGKHILCLCPLDNAIVLQKIAINLGGLHKSFLLPQETVKK